MYLPVMNGLLILYTAFGNNLGWAIVFLTVVLRLLLFPLTRSQLDSSRKLKRIQPELEKIKKKYSRNPQKVQEEQLKLYKKVGYNPLGCFLSVVIPYPFLIAIYQAIRAFSSGEVEGVYGFVADLLGVSGAIAINNRFLFWDLSKSYLPLAKDHGYMTPWVLAYLALALVTGLSQYFSVKMNAQAMGTGGDESKKKKKENESKKKKKDSGELDMSSMMSEMGKSMSFTMPMMTAFIALSAPAAVALYWIIQAWVMVGVHLAYTKFKSKKNGKVKVSKTKKG